MCATPTYSVLPQVQLTTAGLEHTAASVGVDTVVVSVETLPDSIAVVMVVVMQHDVDMVWNLCMCLRFDSQKQSFSARSPYFRMDIKMYFAVGKL